MAVEAKRGCGFRKIGGLYLCADGVATGCDRFPIPLRECNHCGEGVKQTRGFQWVKPTYLFQHAPSCQNAYPDCGTCPVCHPGRLRMDEPGDKTGLVWIGKQFYSPKGWIEEALNLGISKRVPSIPKGMVIGRSRIFVAHPEAYNPQQHLFEGAPETTKDDPVEPAVFAMFVPKRIEIIVTQEMLDGAEAPASEEYEWLAKLIEKGVTPVVVPANDPDHAPPKRARTGRSKARDKYAKAPEKKPEPDKAPPV